MLLTFKEFINKYTSIFEELTPAQKAKVDKWPKATAETRSHTDHYFGQGNDVKEYNLEGTQDKSEAHRAVERHLGQQISPDEYKQGVAKDKYGRSVKIGGLLSKSKAPTQLVNNFANDSTRQGKKFTGLSVKISRHPHDVAGQTSGGQSWEQESCKNFEDGCNNSYLPGEVKHGTVVGYLKDHTGKEIARTTLQPYKNNKGHVMYAVDSHYGINHQGFRDHMEQVAKQLSGEHKGGNITYKVDRNVYNDNGEEKKLHPNLTKEHIDKALSSKNPDIRAAAASHPNASIEHINKALKDDYDSVREAAFKNPSVTTAHIDQGLKDENPYIRAAAVAHPKATAEHIEKALKDKDADVRRAAASHPNATSEHITKAMNDKDLNVRMDATDNPNLTKEHIDMGLKHRDPVVRRGVARHPNISEDQINKALDDRDEYVRMDAIRNSNATAANITKALTNKHQHVRMNAVMHPNATTEHVEKALNDKESDVRAEAAASNKATEAHISKALNDNSPFVRSAAVSNVNATRAHLEQGARDVPSVRVVAKKRLERLAKLGK